MTSTSTTDIRGLERTLSWAMLGWMLELPWVHTGNERLYCDYGPRGCRHLSYWKYELSPRVTKHLCSKHMIQVATTLSEQVRAHRFMEHAFVEEWNKTAAPQSRVTLKRGCTMYPGPSDTQRQGDKTAMTNFKIVWAA